jgi:FkbM family methyltransferase
MKTIIEVGAKDGHDTYRFLQDPENVVYSFEPTPELHLYIQNRFRGNTNYKNLNLVPAAVDITDGFKQFNIAAVEDWGCSSLNEFADDRFNNFPGRDIRTTHSVKVMTIRLDTFMNMHNIKEVDYLWIDAQGSDFNVLKSLGNRINDVKSGKCESSYAADLYKNSNNKTNDIVKWLDENGFNCTVKIDVQEQKEADIYFERK